LAFGARPSSSPASQNDVVADVRVRPKARANTVVIRVADRSMEGRACCRERAAEIVDEVLSLVS
jgi:hypothetical protein